jgi:hypothetical protein
MTHLSLMPKETCRENSLTLQVSPSSAHLEKPLGQSTARAGVENAAANAAQSAVFR